VLCASATTLDVREFDQRKRDQRLNARRQSHIERLPQPLNRTREITALRERQAQPEVARAGVWRLQLLLNMNERLLEPRACLINPPGTPRDRALPESVLRAMFR
jgi:hypothetical protein